MSDIVERLHVVRDHLRTGRFGQREVWEEWLTGAAAEIERLRSALDDCAQARDGWKKFCEAENQDEIERLRTPRFDVVQLQPDEDSPGLWIGFETAAQRAEAMKLFALKDPTP